MFTNVSTDIKKRSACTETQQVVEMKKVPTEGLPGCDVCGHIGQDVFFIRSCFRGFLVALRDLTAQFKRHEQK